MNTAGLEGLVCKFRNRGRLHFLLLVSIGLLVMIFLSSSHFGCGKKGSTELGSIIEVVAGENFWGSIAAQLGGTQVHVITVVNNPSTDPHEYTSTAADARAFASSNYVILNGAGYDSWGQKLIEANPVKGRKLLDIAKLLGKSAGDNPHFWYSPEYMGRVMNQITQDYQSLLPQQSAYFTEQHAAFEKTLTQYHELIASIRQTYAGTKIGSTESIFLYMANALGLNLISPPAFMNAVAEGNEAPAQAVAEFQGQITNKQIAVLVFNKQTITTVTTHVREMAAAKGIPTVGVSETIEPVNVSFQDWQVAQLLALQAALKASH